MARVFEIDKAKVREKDEDFIDYFIDVMNGLVYYCQECVGYSAGHRNEIALNMTVGSYMLGLYPQDVLAAFIENDLMSQRTDDEDPRERVRRALEYRFRFDWDYMLNPEFYEDWANSSDYEKKKEEMSIVFKLA